jgi:hypothetical protein
MRMRDPERQRRKALNAERRREAARQRLAGEEASRDARASSATPQGQARSAYDGGDELFQIALPLSDTSRTISGVISGDKLGVRRDEYGHGAVLDQIECEGWRLEHANYVWEQTGSVSRDKLMSSGQTAAVTGRIIGVYIFRREERFSAGAP